MKEFPKNWNINTVPPPKRPSSQRSDPYSCAVHCLVTMQANEYLKRLNRHIRKEVAIEKKKNRALRRVRMALELGEERREIRTERIRRRVEAKLKESQDSKKEPQWKETSSISGNKL